MIIESEGSSSRFVCNLVKIFIIPDTHTYGYLMDTIFNNLLPLFTSYPRPPV